MPTVTHDMNDYDMLSLHFFGASVYAVGILNLAIWLHESIHEVTIQLSDPSAIRIGHCTVQTTRLVSWYI